MAEIINMPRLSDTMEEGTVAKWYKKVGDEVNEGDILAEIETDKATMEFEAFYSGTLLHIGINEGDTAPVDNLLAIIGKKGEDISKLLSIDFDNEKVVNEVSVDVNEEKNKSLANENNNSLPSKSKNFSVISMPRLSDTMEEGTVVSWLKKVGDKIDEGEIIAEIETDKATMEFESFYSGTLLYIGIDVGQSAKVDSILAIIGEKGSDFSSALEQKNSATKTQETIEQKNEILEEEKKSVNNVTSDNLIREVSSSKKIDEIGDKNSRIFISPLARKIAFEKGIDINKINGSGDGGRIIKRDVDNLKENITSSNFVSTESSVEIPNSQMRKTIAKRLSQSKFSAPHYYLTVEFDVDNLISFRTQINSTGNYKISFNDLIIKASALALKDHPEVNSMWTDDKIVKFDHIHIGVAIAVEDGLIVPVIKFADDQKIQSISDTVKDFAKRANEKKLNPTEIEGSTFTISNLGMFGIKEFTSIINQPNSAILSVGAIITKPVVKNNKISIGNTMTLTLACDHRSVDGANGSKFLQTLKNYIENPAIMLLN
tara:strand:+ start:253 stop:1884 length:1632 start_codon:yes stop_codon:yes gene_type:complete